MVCCVSVVAFCLLLVDVYVLLVCVSVVRCSLSSLFLFVVVCSSLFVVSCVLRFVFCSLPVVCCLFLVLVICCLLARCCDWLLVGVCLMVVGTR